MHIYSKELDQGQLMKAKFLRIRLALAICLKFGKDWWFIELMTTKHLKSEQMKEETKVFTWCILKLNYYE